MFKLALAELSFQDRKFRLNQKPSLTSAFHLDHIGHGRWVDDIKATSPQIYKDRNNRLFVMAVHCTSQIPETYSLQERRLDWCPAYL